MSGRRILILDGIGGLPLGKEIAVEFMRQGIPTCHFDCLTQPVRSFHGVMSAYRKAQTKRSDKDGFTSYPRLTIKPLETMIAEERPSHILVIGFSYKFFDPSDLAYLAKKYGVRLLLYDTDICNLYTRRREFIFFLERELPIYDLVFSSSNVVAKFLSRTCEIDARFLPFGAEPAETKSEEKVHEVSFIGTCDLRRIFLLEGIAQHVAVRGNRWHRNAPLISQRLNRRIIDEPIWGKDVIEMLAGSKIVLNITRTDFYGAETGVNLRIFEALSVGAFLLTDYCPEVADLFNIGQEIEVYRSSEELIDKVEYYLAHDAERARIARAGAMALRERHTWAHRITSLVGQLDD